MNEADTKFDIDALFTQIAEESEQGTDLVLDWHFDLRSDDAELLETLANELEDEFIIHLQAQMTQTDDSGVVTEGPPILTLVRSEMLDADEVKAIAARMQAIADERGLIYEGVSCYDPIDDEEMYGWMSPEDACVRLQHMTEAGLELDAELPWTFLVSTQNGDVIKPLFDEMNANGFDDIDGFDEPDEDGEFAVCIYMLARNNETELTATATKITEIANRFGGELHGIQFFTREDIEMLFGDDDDDEDE